MVDFTKHSEAVAALTSCQSNDEDMRNNARECNHALNKRDGQWEPSLAARMSGKPRYTVDKLNAIVRSIAGQISKNDYDIRIKPAGSGADKDIAEIFDGIIRNIENISGAATIYKMAGRKCAGIGIAGWEVTQEYAQSDSFDQDLKIKPLSNFEDRVWFGPHELPTAEDANYGFVLDPLPTDDYKAQFPEGSGKSLPQDFFDAYWFKADQVIVGRLFRKVEIIKELVKMSDDSVYVVDDKFQSVADDLAKDGITEVARRKRKCHKVTVRKFDGGDWLTKEKDTVFTYLPIIPVYGNFQISENKPVYWGEVDKLLDQQRIYNMLASKEVEEIVLSPPQTTWMTKEQASGNTNDYQNMNVSPRRVYFYNHKEGQMPPHQTGAPQPNMRIVNAMQMFSADINSTSGQFGANLGDNPGIQSGVAVGMQIDQGNDSNLHYVEALSIAICHTAKVLMPAIPVMMPQGTKARLVHQDGTIEEKVIGDQVYDYATKKMVILNDLTQGVYDVAIEANKSFKSRQEMTSKAIMEIGAVDPSIIDLAGDVLLRNIPAPGMEDVANRKRAQLLQAGVIPEEQMTDEEKAKAQEAAKNREPSPQDKIAQAELETAAAKTAEVQSKTMERAINAQMKQRQMATDQQNTEIDQELQISKAQMAFNQQIANNMKTMAETLNIIRESMGATAVVSTQAASAYSNQAEALDNTSEVALDNSQGQG